jgi:hypothetical protein
MVHTNRHNVLSEEIRDESVYLITRCDPRCMGWDLDLGTRDEAAKLKLDCRPAHRLDFGVLYGFVRSSEAESLILLGFSFTYI